MNETPASAGQGWNLACVGLSVRRAGRLVVYDVSLALRSNECLSLVGPNGSGKTTLMLALLGLLPPASGTVALDGQSIQQYSARARGRFAAYVPQNLEQTPALRVYDVVAGGRFPHVGAVQPLAATDHAAIRDALARCGLAELAERPFNALSGGERQKTLLAAALAQDPQVLFLDEPNTGLDPAYQLELIRILRGWLRTGRSVLLTSHDLQLPAALGGRVLALREGRIVADGPAECVLTPEVLGRIYAAPFGTAATPTGVQIVLPAWWNAG